MSNFAEILKKITKTTNNKYKNEILRKILGINPQRYALLRHGYGTGCAEFL